MFVPIISQGSIPNVVARIQLSNVSIAAIQECCFLKIKLFLSTEFNEHCRGLIFESAFEVRLIPSNVEMSLWDAGQEQSQILKLHLNDGHKVRPVVDSKSNVCIFKSTLSSYTLYAKLNAEVHSLPGYFRIYIASENVNLANRQRVLILPFISDKLYIDANESIQFPFFVSNVREIPLPPVPGSSQRSKLLVHEQYGRTIGHHVYDCSVILLSYLYCLLHSGPSRTSNNDGFQNDPLLTTSVCDPDMEDLITRSMSSNRGVCLELGAGVGAVSIGISRFFEKVFITDKCSQLDIIRENMQMNRKSYTQGDTITVEALELDWSEESSITKFSRHIPVGGIDIVLASDVLYDAPLSGLFFDAVRRLTVVDKTVIVISQKLREVANNQEQVQSEETNRTMNAADIEFIDDPPAKTAASSDPNSVENRNDNSQKKRARYVYLLLFSI